MSKLKWYVKEGSCPRVEGILNKHYPQTGKFIRILPSGDSYWRQYCFRVSESTKSNSHRHIIQADTREREDLKNSLLVDITCKDHGGGEG